MLIAGMATSAGASILEYRGTIVVDFGNLGPVPITGMGVVTANATSANTHASTIRMANEFQATNTVPVTDPEVTNTIPSVIVTATIGTGTFTNISGAASNTTQGVGPGAGRVLPIFGLARICLTGGCSVQPKALKLVLNQHTTGSGVNGIGIGGLQTIGGGGVIRLSLELAPWTLKTRTLNSQTANGGFRTLMQHGYVHGPASATTSTLANSGVLQLISPVQLHTTGLPGNSLKIGIFNVLRLHFIPEPGMLLLLGSGVVGMALLGRRRLKK
jgi:hypothetical protein